MKVAFQLRSLISDKLMIKDSLRTRLVVGFTVLAIGPLLLVGVLIAWQSFRVQRTQMLELQHEIARRASNRISAFLRTVETELSLIAQFEELKKPDAEARRRVLSQLLAYKDRDYGPAFETIILLDHERQETIQVSRSADDAMTNRGNRVESEEFIVPLTTDEAYYGSVSFNPVTGEPFMTIAVPVVDLRSGLTTGVLTAEVRLKMMGETVASIDVGQSGQAYILDKEGRVVAHPDPSIVLRGTYFRLPDPDGIVQGLNGNRMVLSSEPIEAGEQTFFLVTEKPVSEALAPIAHTLYIIISLIMAALAIVGILGWLLIRQIIRPIEALATTARAIESGDLSQRVEIRREDELNESLQKERELSELKSRFVSTVSHEFRTPLTSIRSSTEILDHYAEKLSEEKKHQHLHRIQANVDNMIHLLNDVIFIGRVDSGKLALKPVSINIREFCQEVIEEIHLTRKTPCRIHYRDESTCYEALLDEQLLRHILMNLLSNALKYSPNGSDIEFETYCEQERITFRIRDHGIGVPEDEQSALFEAFHRAKNVGDIDGTGLGLSIVKRCVDVHQGQIEFSSQIGEGTTFLITLPILRPQKGEENAKDSRD